MFCAWTHPLFIHSGSNISVVSSVSLCESHVFLISRDLLTSRDVTILMGSWAAGSTDTCGWTHWSLHSDLRSFLLGMWWGKPKPVKIRMQVQDATQQLPIPSWLTYLLQRLGHSGIPEVDPVGIVHLLSHCMICHFHSEMLTIYLRVKNSKRMSSVTSVLFYSSTFQCCTVNQAD